MKWEEFKKKWNLRHVRGSDVEEDENKQLGLYISPCMAGYQVKHFGTNGRLLHSRIAGSLQSADKAFTRWTAK